MTTRRLVATVLAAALLLVGTTLSAQEQAAAPGETVMKLKLSGPGAINDSTIKAGEKVSVDVYYANAKPRRLFFLGLNFSSPDIKTVVHVADSGKGLKDHSDIKGHNGFEDHSIWDFTGTLVGTTDWDGTLPDVAGVGGVSVKRGFDPQPLTKNISFDMIFPTPGTVIVDTCSWGMTKNANVFIVGQEREAPAWDGPYRFRVVK